ncbi:MAG: hypothetical protein GY757_34360, partial [bacterium]|nr:hypothetical protein [bacterium]
MDDYLSNKEITIEFTIDKNPAYLYKKQAGEYAPLTEIERATNPKKKLWLGKEQNGDITIRKLFKELYYETEEDWKQKKNGKCTASVLFHEMIHAALGEAKKKKELKDKFCVNFVTTVASCSYDEKSGKTVTNISSICTNNENFNNDEAIAEDCQLKVLPCGNDPYKTESGIKDDGSRAFNPPGDDDCSEELCNKEDKCNKKCPDKNSKCAEKSAGGETPDDNYSFSSGYLSGYRQSPDTIILAKGFYQEAETLFGGLLFDGKSSARELLKVSKTMIIPSGAMFHCVNDLTLKNVVSEYTRLGGTVVFFTQQYGEHIERFVPIPADEIIKMYGWHEDQSCLQGSVYFDTPHPVVASQTTQQVSAAVDGYIDTFPSTATT